MLTFLFFFFCIVFEARPPTVKKKPAATKPKTTTLPSPTTDPFFAKLNQHTTAAKQVAANPQHNLQCAGSYTIPGGGRGLALMVIVSDEHSHAELLHSVHANAESWFRYLLVPQRMSLLIVIDDHSFTAQYSRYIDIVSALNITAIDNETRTAVKKKTLRPSELRFVHGTVPVEIVHLHDPLPDNPDIAEEKAHNGKGTVVHYSGPMRPPPCARSAAYVRGTRLYTSPRLWALPQLKQTDFIIKFDFDVFFFAEFPFRIAGHMAARHALIAHTGVFCPGSASCDYRFAETKAAVLALEHRETLCSDIGANSDYFFGNFIVMSARLLRETRVQRFFADMYNSSFWFVGRWTDQLFWHQALQLTTVKPFDSVLDYTQYRCVPRELDGSVPALWNVVHDQATFRRSCMGSVFQHKGTAQQWYYNSTNPSATLKLSQCSGA